jgi:hypothetical protein
VDVVRALKEVVSLYKARGFQVDVFLADGEFEPLRQHVHELGGVLNTTSNDEHVGDIERYIRTIKERARSTFHLTPFRKIPTVMTQHLVGGCVFWLNAFPCERGISDTMSPRTIISGMSIDYHRHCRIMFGAYAQVHEEHDNSMQARTTGAIALRPTGNEQGGFYFMSLTTGRVLNRNHWHELPMPQDVIKRVHDLARRSYASRDLVFQFRDGAPVDDDDESAADEDYDPYSDEDGDDDDSDLSDDGNDADNADDDEDADQFEGPNLHDSDDNKDDDAHIPTAEEESVISNESGSAEHDVVAEPKTDGVEQNRESDDDDDELAGVAGENKSEVSDTDDDEHGDPVRKHNYNLRPVKPRSYKHLHPDLEDVMMTQLSLKKGLEQFGAAGAEAVSDELKQLHDRRAMVPKAAHMLTREEKQRALRYLMYLKKKRCGRIKGRGCADGRKQRIYKTKEESSSPTVAIESLFLTAVIDAKEKRYVATCDIPGAFLHAEMDEVVHMRIDGPLARLLVNIDPKLYEPFLTFEEGKPVIYVKLEKALYGTLQASLLFWRNLSGYLIEQGFVLNPYDECVANKIVSGKQCTIVWHVDDLKISHEDKSVVESVVALLQKKYGSDDAPVTVTYGKVHDYLGMTLDYSRDGKVTINMAQYVTEFLRNVPDGMGKGTSVTPAAGHLYEVRSDAEPLDKLMSEQFHTLTAKLLFLSKRARPDLQQAVGFLTTRVKSPDTDDWKKLNRVIQYLRGTRELNLTLEADSTHVVKWWVDAAFAVHPDMRSQTGMTMTLGKGSVYAGSVRQKLNTRSSTEAELVGVDDSMGMILWTRLFLESQGYEVKNTKIYQDNQSAALMERNGKRSSTKRTRHINIRYFFITDCIKDGGIDVEYCPTENMLADIFTKPLQGNAFRKFRDAVLNTHSSSADSSACSTSESQECVEECSSDGLSYVGCDADVAGSNELKDRVSSG